MLDVREFGILSEKSTVCMSVPNRDGAGRPTVGLKIGKQDPLMLGRKF